MSDRVLRVALPWLDRARLAGATGDTPRLPATEWLLARATRQGEAGDWREWLLDGSSPGPSLLARFPQGPCVRAAQTHVRPTGVWACAAPVHLVAGLDHLRLAAPAPLPLDASDSLELVSDLNARLGGRGFTLHDHAGGWLCECPVDLACTAPPPAASVGRNLRETMPTGRDAAHVIAWVSELQMVLHDHPVNGRRLARGLPPVNSVWLWGFGAAVTGAGTPRDVLLTDDDWLAGLWRLRGADPVEPERLETVVEGNAPVTRIGLAAVPGAEEMPGALEQLERRLSAPLRAALEARTLAGVAVLCGAAQWSFGRRSRWRAWRRPRPLAELLP